MADAQKWTETGRNFIGLYMSGPCRGPGWGNAGYYQAVYEVSEHCVPTGEMRVRIEHGPACRDYGEGYRALVSLYEQYTKKAREAKPDG